MKTLLIWISLGLVTMGWAEPEARLKEIRKWYNAIQEGKVIVEKKIEFEAANEPLSGKVTIRDYKDGLKAITMSFGSEHGGADQHFYYRDGELFFLFEEESVWRFTGEEDPEGVSIVMTILTENRYYWEGKKCIRKLTRTVSGTGEEKLPALLKKKEQKEEKPGDEITEILGFGESLLGAKTEAEVLKAFAAELEPAE